jgi:hypothetical protein
VSSWKRTDSFVKKQNLTGWLIFKNRGFVTELVLQLFENHGYENQGPELGRRGGGVGLMLFPMPAQH